MTVPFKFAERDGEMFRAQKVNAYVNASQQEKSLVANFRLKLQNSLTMPQIHVRLKCI